MKIRNGFVSNSSSSSFLVYSKTKTTISWRQFATELAPIIKKYLIEYGDVDHQISLDQQAENIALTFSKEDIILEVEKKRTMFFGDNHGHTGILGSAIDYIVRDGKFETDNFCIKFLEMNR